jgi:hypothetical protein
MLNILKAKKKVPMIKTPETTVTLTRSGYDSNPYNSRVFIPTYNNSTTSYDFFIPYGFDPTYPATIGKFSILKFDSTTEQTSLVTDLETLDTSVSEDCYFSLSPVKYFNLGSNTFSFLYTKYTNAASSNTTSIKLCYYNGSTFTTNTVFSWTGSVELKTMVYSSADNLIYLFYKERVSTTTTYYYKTINPTTGSTVATTSFDTFTGAVQSDFVTAMYNNNQLMLFWWRSGYNLNAKYMIKNGTGAWSATKNAVVDTSGTLNTLSPSFVRGTQPSTNNYFMWYQINYTGVYKKITYNSSTDTWATPVTWTGKLPLTAYDMDDNEYVYGIDSNTITGASAPYTYKVKLYLFNVSTETWTDCGYTPNYTTIINNSSLFFGNAFVAKGYLYNAIFVASALYPSSDEPVKYIRTNLTTKTVDSWISQTVHYSGASTGNLNYNYRMGSNRYRLLCFENHSNLYTIGALKFTF